MLISSGSLIFVALVHQSVFRKLSCSQFCLLGVGWGGMVLQREDLCFKNIFYMAAIKLAHLHVCMKSYGGNLPSARSFWEVSCLWSLCSVNKEPYYTLLSVFLPKIPMLKTVCHPRAIGCSDCEPISKPWGVCLLHCWRWLRYRASHCGCLKAAGSFSFSLCS